MGTIELSTEISAPIERVFQLLVEPERFREWWVNPPIGFEARTERGRSMFRLMVRERGRTYQLVGRILTMEPPTRFCWEAEVPPPGLRDLEERWTLTGDVGRTTLRFRTEYRLSGPSWLAAFIDHSFVRRQLRRRYLQEQENLRRLAEAR